jgi:hypothetical protein
MVYQAMWSAQFPSGEGTDFAGTTFLLDQVRAAFTQLVRGHIRGNIVVLP